MRQSKGQRGPEHVTNNYCCSDEVGVRVGVGVIRILYMT